MYNMPLKCFKSFSKVQTINKPRSTDNKDHIAEMLHTEVHDVSPKIQKKYSSKPGIETHKKEAKQTLHEQSLLDGKVIKRKKENLQNIIKSEEENLRKHRAHGSHHRSREITSEIKKETKHKAKDVKVRQIPFKNSLVEFSVERSQCPIVVRIHKERLNTSRNKRRSERSHSQLPNHSLSCPPRIDDQCKITLDRTNNVEIPKSKYRIMFQKCTVSELLNLSRRKSDIATKKSRHNPNKFTGNDKPEQMYGKKTLGSKCRPQNSSVNQTLCSCAEDKLKGTKAKCSLNKNKPQDKSVKEKLNSHHRKVDKNKVDVDYHSNFTNCSDPLNVECIPYKYLISIKTRDTSGHIKYSNKESKSEHCNIKDTQIKQTGRPMTEKRFMIQKNKVNNENGFPQQPAEGTILHKGLRDGYSQRFEKDRDFIMCAFHELPETNKGGNNAIYSPGRCLTLETGPTEKKNVPENVVTLDASQSQFYKISHFIKHNPCQCCKNSSSEQMNETLSTENKGFICNDKKYTKKTESKTYLHSSVYRKTKIRSDECLVRTNSFIGTRTNDQYVLSLNPQRYKSSFSSLNKNCCQLVHSLDYKKVLNKSQTSPYYICLGCNRSVCSIKSFHPYCSDCNLKSKLAQISNERVTTNVDSELKEGSKSSVKALTIIPESDISLSKKCINVAIQTNCDLGNESQEYKIATDPKNTYNNPSHSLENMFKMYCSMVSQLKKLQGSPLNSFLSISDCNRLSPSNSLEPNVNDIRETMIKQELEKKNISADYCSSPVSQTKTSDPCFYSPIFPEKQYFRINVLKPSLALRKALNESYASKHSIDNLINTNYSQEFNNKPKDNILYSNDLGLCHCLSVEKETSSPRKDVDCLEGTYTSGEKTITFSNEMKKSNSFSTIPKDKSVEGNMPSCKREKSFSDHVHVTPSFSFTFKNVTSSLMSFDQLKGFANECCKENYKINNRHTLPREITKPNLNDIIHKSEQLPYSTSCLGILSGIPFKNQQKCKSVINIENSCSDNEIMIKNTETNREIKYLQKENILHVGVPNTLVHKPIKMSKIDIHTEIKSIKKTTTEEDVKEGINMPSDYGVTKNEIISLKCSKINVDENKIKKTFERNPETIGMLELHSFSYILFHISIPDGTCVASEVEDTYRDDISSDTGLVLMPETNGNTNDNNLNDIILGNKFKTQITNRLFSRKETYINGLNVFELNNLSDLPKEDAFEGSNIQVYNTEKDILQNKPLIYKPIAPCNDVHDSKNVANIPGTIYNPALNDNQLDLFLIEPNNKRKNNEVTINLHVLGKNTSKSLKEKKTNAKGLKEKIKCTKISNIFMCTSRNTKVSFSRFMGDVQNKVCAQLRKSKFVC